MPLFDVGIPMWNFITNQLLELQQQHAEEGKKASVAADIPDCYCVCVWRLLNLCVIIMKSYQDCS